ncbi:S22AN protein, partial [Uria aalge]|nr:S22AN protein [Uria aalge]
MAIDRRREAGGGGRPLPEENGSVPGVAGGVGVANTAAPPGPPPANAAGAEIQALPVPAPAAACSPLLLDYDGSVLPFLGGLGGGYQRTLVLLTWVPALFIGFSKFSDSFLLDQPDFWCREADGQGNWSGSLAPGHANRSGNGSIFPPPGLPTPAGVNASECDCHEWHYRIRAGLVQNVVSKWDLVCDSAWKVHIAKFSLLVGLIFGHLITGCIADWVGRRPVLLFSVIFILIFGLTVALSVNVTMFSTLRFFEGFCLAGIVLSLYALRIELCPPGHRFMITMVASFIEMAGQFLMPGLAALCRDWQVLQAVIICPFLLMLLYWVIFPESLRWLMATQQFEASKELILQFTHKNKMNTESDIKGVVPELEKEITRRPKKVCIVKVVGTRNLWKNIVVLCVNSLAGYGDLGSASLSLALAFLAQSCQAKAVTLGVTTRVCRLSTCKGLAWRGEHFYFFTLLSCHPLYLASFSLFMNTLVLAGMSDSVKDKFSTAFSIVGMFSSHAVGSLSVFFCAEITPTVIRGGGLGLVLASAGFGRLTAPIMELHNQKGYFLHHVIFACCTLLCIICILLLPESKNQNLPENIPDGEHYTRQPLLPHKKGEQPLLLTNSELKDYSGLHDSSAVSDGISENTTANGMKSM